MNWEAIGAIAELLGAIGVIASLVYVGIQVRQNTRSVRAATYDAMVRTSGDFLSPLIEDPELAAAFERAVASWPEVDPRSRERVMYLLTQLFRNWENAFFQWKQGTLAQGLWAPWRRVILSYYHQPGLQEWWKVRKTAYSEEFQRYLESSEPPPVSIRTTRQLQGGDDGS
jgi:hypothetical protein